MKKTVEEVLKLVESNSITNLKEDILDFKKKNFKNIDTLQINNKQIENYIQKMEYQKKNELDKFKEAMQKEFCLKIEEQEKELEKQKKMIEKLQTNNNIVYNITNNKTINYLNINFSNIQPIDKFVYNLEHTHPLSLEDRKCLLNTYNECGIDAFSDTFSFCMKKNQEQQVEDGQLPAMPVLCTDGNQRSHKEFNSGGWETKYDNKNIDKMIDISNRQIYESENTMIHITQKERKKVYNKMKQHYTLNNLELAKEKFFKKKIGNITESKKEISLIKNEENEKDGFDFSIIDEELLEKNLSKSNEILIKEEKIDTVNSNIKLNINDPIPSSDNLCYILDCGREYKYEVETNNVFNDMNEFIGKRSFDDKYKVYYIDYKQ